MISTIGYAAIPLSDFTQNFFKKVDAPCSPSFNYVHQLGNNPAIGIILYNSRQAPIFSPQKLLNSFASQLDLLCKNESLKIKNKSFLQEILLLDSCFINSRLVSSYLRHLKKTYKISLIVCDYAFCLHNASKHLLQQYVDTFICIDPAEYIISNIPAMELFVLSSDICKQRRQKSDYHYVHVIKLEQGHASNLTPRDLYEPSFINVLGTIITQARQYKMHKQLLACVNIKNPSESQIVIAHINKNLLSHYSHDCWLDGAQAYWSEVDASTQILTALKPYFSCPFWYEWSNPALKKSLQKIMREHLALPGKDSLFRSLSHTALLSSSSQLLGQIPFLAHTKEFSAAHIVRGGSFCYMLRYMQRDMLLKNCSTRTNQLQAIVDLMWYLYAEALNKNEPFDHGTVVIKDTHFGLYNFLLSYVKRCNPSITGTIKDTANWISFNPFAYSRASTHFAYSQENNRQYGIDIRFDRNEKVSSILPSNKCHILFGKVDEQLQLMFIKLEHHGIYAYDGWVGHMSGFFASRTRRSLPTLEKVLPRSWYDWIEKKVGHNDDPGSRRERVPLSIQSDFKELVVNATLSPIKRKQCMQVLERYGIRALYAFTHNDWRYINNILAHNASKKDIGSGWLPASFLANLQLLVFTLNLDYDYLPYRTGREVILDDKEFSSSLYYYLLLTDTSKAIELKPFFDHILQARIIARSINSLKFAHHYTKIDQPPLSTARQLLCKELFFLTDQKLLQIAAYSAPLAQLLKGEICNLKKIAQ